MILPSNDECRRVLKELEDEPELSEWEAGFVADNLARTHFTDAQKEVVARFKEKFET